MRGVLTGTTAVRIDSTNEAEAGFEGTTGFDQGSRKHETVVWVNTAPCVPCCTQEGQEGLQLNARPPSKRQAQSETANGQASSDKKQTGFQQTVVDDETQAIKVSLNDCLACSGCVTSAETVLLQHQSLKEFIAKCTDPDVTVVVSISPQSRASLAGAHNTTSIP